MVIWGASNIFSVYDDLIEFYDDNGKAGVMKSDGTLVISASYDSICCSPDGFFAVEKNGVEYLIDSDENILRELGDVVVNGYIESLDCWRYISQSKFDTEEIHGSIDGFIRQDGSEIIEMVSFSVDADNDGIRAFGWPFFSPTLPILPSPAIIYNFMEGTLPGRFLIIRSLDDLAFTTFGAYTRMPIQGVIVVTDGYDTGEGEFGLVSNTGEVLFEMQDCKIFTNEKYDPGTITAYKYDTYNDSDYLIYMVEAQ